MGSLKVIPIWETKSVGIASKRHIQEVWTSKLSSEGNFGHHRELYSWIPMRIVKLWSLKKSVKKCLFFTDFSEEK